MATFGNTNAEASLGDIETDHFNGCLFTAPGDGTVSKFTIHARSWYAGCYLKPVLVLHSDLTVVGVGDSVEIPNATTDWIDLPFTTQPDISNGVDYLLGFVAYGYVSYSYTTGDTNQSHEETDNNFATPTDLTSITHTSQEYSIYATYTESAGGGVKTTTAKAQIAGTTTYVFQADAFQNDAFQLNVGSGTSKTVTAFALISTDYGRTVTAQAAMKGVISVTVTVKAAIMGIPVGAMYHPKYPPRRYFGWWSRGRGAIGVLRGG